MPIYEYYCNDCHGVFELLRQARESSLPQPCPECDAACPRLMPTSLQLRTLRDGVPRRLPDRGTFWHLGEEVSAPIRESVPAGEHPELYAKKRGPARPPTAEERDAFEARHLQRLEEEAESVASGRPPVRDLHEERRVGKFVKRVRQTADQQRALRRKTPNATTTPRTRSGTHQPSTTSEGARGFPPA